MDSPAWGGEARLGPLCCTVTSLTMCVRKGQAAACRGGMGAIGGKGQGPF